MRSHLASPWRRSGQAVLVLTLASALLAATRVSAVPRLADWTATLAGTEGRKVAGTATVKPTATGGMTVTITLDGDTPGATRPWHVHSGRCTQSGAVVGAPRAYPPIPIDPSGHGMATATLDVALSDTATYLVNVHDAAAAMPIIVACGELRKH